MRKGSDSRCPPVHTRAPYNELTHQLGKTKLSVKVSKNAGNLKSPDGTYINSPENDSKTACAKVNIINNKAPPTKRPEQEQLLIRTTRQILNSEEMKNTLEIDLKFPRNYDPLPPPPPFKILFTGDEDINEKNGKVELNKKIIKK